MEAYLEWEGLWSYTNPIIAILEGGEMYIDYEDLDEDDLEIEDSKDDYTFHNGIQIFNKGDHYEFAWDDDVIWAKTLEEAEEQVDDLLYPERHYDDEPLYEPNEKLEKLAEEDGPEEYVIYAKDVYKPGESHQLYWTGKGSAKYSTEAQAKKFTKAEAEKVENYKGSHEWVKKYVGDAADKISHTVSPMVATGRWLKEQYPDAVTVFIGPCIAKKSEAKENPEYIDYVLTFEEAMCLMEGKDIKVENVEAVEFERDGSKVGLGFPLTAGVTAAVNATVNAKGGSVRATHYAAGVDKCVTDLTAVTKGQIDCSYFEGMACSNGCIDGPGTVGDFRLTKVALSKYAEVAPVTAAVDSKHTK